MNCTSESRGFAHGHDSEDWFVAESEILLNLVTNVAETEGQFAIRAKVPGFTEHDLEVRVAPRSVCISGGRQGRTDRTEPGRGFFERRAHRIFRVLELSGEVDPARVEASVGDGVLEVKLPKVGLRKLVPVRVKSATA
jgi:HSP20 family protein